MIIITNILKRAEILDLNLTLEEEELNEIVKIIRESSWKESRNVKLIIEHPERNSITTENSRATEALTSLQKLIEYVVETWKMRRKKNNDKNRIGPTLWENESRKYYCSNGL